MTTVYIIHGYGATPQDHWFPLLKQRFEGDSVNVVSIALPDSKNPQLDAWQATLEEKLLPATETYIVAHSLGVITTLRFLANHTIAIQGAVFVSGFMEPLEGLGLLDPFVENLPDLEEVGARIPHKHMFLSNNDYIVPPAASVKLAKIIGADVTTVDHAGHFLAEDTILDVPQVYQMVRGWYKEQPRVEDSESSTLRT